MSIINFVKLEPDAGASGVGAGAAGSATGNTGLPVDPLAAAALEDTQEVEPVVIDDPKPRGRFTCGCGFNIVDDSEGDHAYHEFQDMVQDHLDSCAFTADPSEVTEPKDGKADGCRVGDYASEVVSEVRRSVQMANKYTADSFLSENPSSHALKAALHLLQAAYERSSIDVPEQQRMHAIRRYGELKGQLKKFMGELGFRDPKKPEDRGIMAPRHGLARAAQFMFVIGNDVAAITPQGTRDLKS